MKAEGINNKKVKRIAKEGEGIPLLAGSSWGTGLDASLLRIRTLLSAELPLPIP